MLCNTATLWIFNFDHFVAFSRFLHADGEGTPLSISVCKVHGHDMLLHVAEECRTHTEWSLVVIGFRHSNRIQ